MVLKSVPADSLRDPSRRIESFRAERNRIAALLSSGETVSVPRAVGKHLRVGDFVIQNALAAGGQPDTLILRTDFRQPELLDASIGYAAKPQLDRQQRGLIRTEVTHKSFGIQAVYLSSDAVRDYFYVTQYGRPWDRQTPFYDLLRVNPSAKPGDLRLAFKVRHLEGRVAAVPRATLRSMDRAFNVLSHPELRQVYAELLQKPSALALFPYGGFGRILVSGERSRDGGSFFARAIYSFLPVLERRKLTVRLRAFQFQHDEAVYRDAAQKLEIRLDPINLPVGFDPTWNTWKHLLSTKLGIEADFAHTGKYAKQQDGTWNLTEYQTALPSSIAVSLPDDWESQTEAALRAHHRFGQFSLALSHIRKRIEREPIEASQLRNLLAELRVPPDFEVERITWGADYDIFFFEELKKRCRRLYLFRSEYIFELERAIVVEVPQFGHATYLYLRKDVEEFVKLYAKCSRQEVRRNQANVAERMEFIGRIAHTKDHSSWLRELRLKLGEPLTFVQAIS